MSSMDMRLPAYTIIFKICTPKHNILDSPTMSSILHLHFAFHNLSSWHGSIVTSRVINGNFNTPPGSPSQRDAPLPDTIFLVGHITEIKVLTDCRRVLTQKLKKPTASVAKGHQMIRKDTFRPSSGTIYPPSLQIRAFSSHRL